MESRLEGEAGGCPCGPHSADGWHPPDATGWRRGAGDNELRVNLVTGY